MACCMTINSIQEAQTMPITGKRLFTTAMDVDPD